MKEQILTKSHTVGKILNRAEPWTTYQPPRQRRNLMLKFWSGNHSWNTFHISNMSFLKEKHRQYLEAASGPVLVEGTNLLPLLIQFHHWVNMIKQVPQHKQVSNKTTGKKFKNYFTHFPFYWSCYSLISIMLQILNKFPLSDTSVVDLFDASNHVLCTVILYYSHHSKISM